jgi:serine/threonine protein kinase
VADSPLTEGPIVLAGRYELGTRLGTGGMADVFLARDTLLGREVAVKVFRAAVTEERFDERQRAEIALLARLNHPGLVTLFDAGSGVFGDGAHRAFLVLELVPGLSLADRLRRGLLPAAQAAVVGAQVAESLGYIHAAGVVHRDVKPANILLPAVGTGATESWTKLADFGIARLVEDAHLTSTGLLLGTPGYLSPEQATGVSPGPPTDVYALGLVLLECRTGARAYPGSGLESATARLHRDPDIPAGLGSSWTRLLAAMTARDVDARPTAIEASRELRAMDTPPAATRVLPIAAAPMATVPMTAAAGATVAMAKVDDAATQVQAAPAPPLRAARSRRAGRTRRAPGPPRRAVTRSSRTRPPAAAPRRPRRPRGCLEARTPRWCRYR